MVVQAAAVVVAVLRLAAAHLLAVKVMQVELQHQAMQVVHLAALAAAVQTQ
jgi:hypothetical protein